MKLTDTATFTVSGKRIPGKDRLLNVDPAGLICFGEALGYGAAERQMKARAKAIASG